MRPTLRSITERSLVAPISAAAYLSLIPWDTRNRPATQGAINETSPVSSGGVLSLAIVLILCSVYLAWRRTPLWVVALLAAAPPALLLLVSLATHHGPDADIWPLAWTFFATLLGLGTVGVSMLSRAALSSRGNDLDRPARK
jgi:hypothetical protein